MSVKIGINGFGRIGHLVFRAALEKGGLDIVGINDITDAKTLAHLLKYDSTQGRFKGTVEHAEKALIVNGNKIPVMAEFDPAKLPWGDLGAQIVIESTGKFRTREDASKHIAGGAKKVLISAPGKKVDGTFVLGVNADDYDPKKHDIISIGSCTTNCLAPVTKVLVDNFGIAQGFMTTIHAYTSDQRLLDAPHKDLHRSRSAALSMIPTTTGAAKAISEVIPAVKGKLDGLSMRVPTPVGSVVDLVAVLEKEATIESINKAMKAAAEGKLKGILEYNEDPIVSIDVVGNPHSSVFDATQTMANGKMVKVFSWYDNEWGFSNRMADMLSRMMG